MRRALIVPPLAALALGLGVAAGSARSDAGVPARLVGAYDTYFPAAPTVRAHWVIAIGPRGSFVFTTPLATREKAGPVSVEGNTVTFPPDVARGGTCSGPGVYTWSLIGKTLTFTRVVDDCKARNSKLTRRPWKRFKGYTVVIIVRR